MATDSELQDANVLLRALANPQRMKIPSVSPGGELSVGDLLSKIVLSQSALSQHLAKLRAETGHHLQTVLIDRQRRI